MASDLVILNAKVWTANPRQAQAAAVAVRAGRMTAVGSNAEIRGETTRDTEVIDAGGRLLVPGFNDAHVHLLSAGSGLLGVDFREAANEKEFVKLVAEQLAHLPKGSWLTRGRWDHESWPGRQRPTRHLIDPVSPHHPVFLRRLDGHVAVANSLALQLAGIAPDTPDPPGGRIVRDPQTHEPTGVLVDAAARLVQSVIPEDGQAEALEAARAALRHAARVGVTSVQTPCSLRELSLYRQLRGEEELTARVYAILLAAPAEAVQELELRQGGEAQQAGCGPAARRGDEWLRTGAVKIFADGSFGARSALLGEPYGDDPTSVGLAMHEVNELNELVRQADAAGLQVALHAIGDEAVHRALNAFERAIEANGRRGARHRIEHAQMVRPADRGRFAALGVIASIQPSHCIDDMRWIETRLGRRCEYAYPYRSLLDAGACVALGTDWDVEPLEPVLGLYAAVTRRFPRGVPPGGWYPGEKVPIGQALSDYTAGSAYAQFQEQQKGSIEPGKLADLVLLSKDLLTVPPKEILATEVVMTVVGGKVVFRSSD